MYVIYSDNNNNNMNFIGLKQHTSDIEIVDYNYFLVNIMFKSSV